MTEASRHLQEAPRKGATNLVACSPVRLILVFSTSRDEKSSEQGLDGPDDSNDPDMIQFVLYQ